jgi:hypothetical protein
MVNLLFISCNSKIDTVKRALQPLLKIKIDIVVDFDYGLKEVFEKRPAMVFIQDQIAGVTGDSVARHIQMLLGSDAPSFVFMHDGNLKAKPVKGLYDYLIDLSQDDRKILADIQSTLILILGSQWQKIYIPPKASESEIVSTTDRLDEHPVQADQLVDDFLSDLGNASSAPIAATCPLTEFALPDESSDEIFDVISSHHDQLAEMISENARDQQIIELANATARNVIAKNISSPSEPTDSSVQIALPAISLESEAPDVHRAGNHSKTPSAVPRIPVSAVHAALPVQKHSTSTTPDVQPPPISPADFRIERERGSKIVAQGESLRTFEMNHRSKTATRKRYLIMVVVIMLCLLAGGWHLVKKNRSLEQSRIIESPQATVSELTAQSVTPLPVTQKSISTAQRETTALPSSIPLEGHDPDFAAKKPGWERYIGSDYEYRVYRSGSRLKAIQVLATNGGVIGEPRLKLLLTELTGTGEYHITLQEQKHGFQLTHAIVNRKADLLIYRKNTAIHAFVVSLE